MKKLTLIILAVLTPLFFYAQNDLTAFFNQYAGQEGFTSINISKDAFKLLASINIEGEGAEELEAAKQISEKMNGLQVLVYEGDQENFDAAKLFNQAISFINDKNYKELMSLKSDEDNVRILVKNTKDGVIDQMIIIVSSDEEFVLVNVDGQIDLNQLTRISKQLDIDALEDLEDIGEDK
jgi:Domain of unknown function (DUF4252)